MPGSRRGLPHPFHLEQFRAVDGSAAATRQETAVHVQLRVGATVGPRLEVTLFGGPTFFDVEQTLVSDILFEETYPGLSGFPNAILGPFGVFRG